MKFLRYIPVILFALLALFFLRGLSLNPRLLPSVKLNQPLPEFTLPSVIPNARELIPKHFRGKVVLLNIWGSWCSVCSEEQVFLLHLAHIGINIYGINEKEDPQMALTWLNEWGNPYREVGSDADGKLARDLGVYGAPETFLIDKLGVIRYRHTGKLDKKIWDEILAPQYKALEDEL